MRKLSISNAAIMSLAIQDEITRSETSRYDHRLHAILLVSHGNTCYQVAEWFREHPRTIERWVTKFEQHGFAGLQDTCRTGRPSQLDDSMGEKINSDLRQSPRALGYTQNLWDGKLLSHHIATVYSIKLGVRQCQRLFTKFGFRRRKPRSVIAGADPELKEQYKKNSTYGRTTKA